MNFEFHGDAVADFQDMDYYELLGVPRTATQDEIKRAYRREITKYHPDRFVNAPAEQQHKAQRHSQRLTEAYATLNNFKTRSSYNASLSAGGVPTGRPSTTPSQARDHQAELYDQASAHLKSGHTLQAVAALRQLQQINPFYRDSADLLAQAEAKLQADKRTRTDERRPRRLFLVAGGMGGLALVGVAAWALAQRGTIQPQPNGGVGVARTAQAAPASVPTSQPQTTAIAAVATAIPTTEPTAEPTAAPIEAPTVVPTVAPTVAPTEIPTLVPTEAPTALPVVEGQTLFSDDFASGFGWAETAGRGWEVGYNGDRYRIGVDPYVGSIWTYRSLRLENYSIATDIQVTVGEGGILLWFANQDSYLAYVLNPSQTSYRLEQRTGDTVNILTGGQSDVIRSGRQAVNRLQARSLGDKVQLLINGQQVAEATIDGPSAIARFGLVGISGAGSAEAYFDNVEVKEIE